MTNPEVVIGDKFRFNGRADFLKYANHISGKDSVNQRVAAMMEPLGYGDGGAIITVTGTSPDGLSITAIDVQYPDHSKVLHIDAKSLRYNHPIVAIFGRVERAMFLTKLDAEVSGVREGQYFRFKSAAALKTYGRTDQHHVNAKVCRAMTRNGFDHTSSIQILEMTSRLPLARSVRMISADNTKSMVLDAEALGIKTIGGVAIFTSAEIEQYLELIAPITKPIPPSIKPVGGLYDVDVVVVPGKVACSFNEAFKSLYTRPPKLAEIMSKVEVCQKHLDSARDAKKAALAEIKRQNEILNKADEDIVKYTDALVGATYIMVQGDK